MSLNICIYLYLEILTPLYWTCPITTQIKSNPIFHLQDSSFLGYLLRSVDLSPQTILIFFFFLECCNIQRYFGVVYMITFRKRAWKWEREMVGYWGQEEQWVAKNDKQVGSDTTMAVYPPIFFFLSFCYFFGPLLQHMEVHRLGV